MLAILTRGLAVFLFLLALSPLTARASYPESPITIVVPIAPGGGTDIFARVLAKELSSQMGVPVIVENRPGAGNVIGIRNVVNAPPDGSRLLFTSNTITIDQSIKKQPEFDVLNDLEPISNVVNGVYALLVNNDVPANTLAEFIAYAKANPGKLNYSSTGTATTGHLASEEFGRVTGISLFHVPYSGLAPAMTALLSGDVQVLWGDALAALPSIKAGKIKILAVASATRSPVVPDVPTVAESGYPGFEPAFKFGLYAPRGTPKDIIDRLHREVVTALQSPSIQQAAAERGWQLDGNSPSEFKAMLSDEVEFWARIVREAGIERK